MPGRKPSISVCGGFAIAVGLAVIAVWQFGIDAPPIEEDGAVRVFTSALGGRGRHLPGQIHWVLAKPPKLRGDRTALAHFCGKESA